VRGLDTAAGAAEEAIVGVAVAVVLAVLLPSAALTHEQNRSRPIITAHPIPIFAPLVCLLYHDHKPDRLC